MRDFGRRLSWCALLVFTLPLGAVAQEPSEVVEWSGARLRAVGQTLERVLPDPFGPRVLTPILDREPGTIYALVHDRLGRTTWVGAERGLFLASDDLWVLEPLEIDGAPERFAIQALHLDAARRLWVVTEEELLVVESSWLRASPTGLRPPGGFGAPVRIEARENGGLLIVHAGGAVSYEPDVGPAPAVSVLTGPGSAPLADRIASDFGSVLELQAAGFGRGPNGQESPARILYTVDAHHRPLVAERGRIVLEDLRPGLRVLRVYAEDQDLRRSPPRLLEIAVALPWFLERKAILTFGFSYVGLVSGLALLRWHRRGRAQAALGRTLLSALLIVWLTGMVVAGLFPHARGWPFVGFAMYTKTTNYDQVVSDVKLRVIEPGGAHRPLILRHLGLKLDGEWLFIRPFLIATREENLRWIEKHRELRPDRPIAGIAVIARRSLVTRTGAVDLPDLVRGAVVEGPR